MKLFQFIIFLVASTLLVVAEGQRLTRSRLKRNQTSPTLFHINPVPLGEAFNLFNRYGFLGFSIRVAPFNITDFWLFRESTYPVFQRDTFLVNRQKINQTVVERHIQLHLCGSVESLLQSFFANFTIDGLQRPWRAFTASWRKPLLARLLGLQLSHLMDDHRFLLIKLEKHVQAGSIRGAAALNPAIAERAGNIVVGALRETVDFFLDQGTHFIKSYLTGDALYQILVYDPVRFEQVRQRVQDIDLTSLSKEEQIALFATTPDYIGKLQVASGNRTLVQDLESVLNRSPISKALPSIIRLLTTTSAMNYAYQALQERAVLGLELTALISTTSDLPQKSWLVEVLYNLLRVWELNL